MFFSYWLGSIIVDIAGDISVLVSELEVSLVGDEFDILSKIVALRLVLPHLDGVICHSSLAIALRHSEE